MAHAVGSTTCNSADVCAKGWRRCVRVKEGEGGWVRVCIGKVRWGGRKERFVVCL